MKVMKKFTKSHYHRLPSTADTERTSERPQRDPEVKNVFNSQLSMKISLLISMKMPTILQEIFSANNMKMPTKVGIFIFSSRENYMLSYAQLCLARKCLQLLVI